MENLKHTPGPWEISDDNSWECAVLTSKETHIIEVKNNDMSETGFDEMYANAKLIAAAPELLEALQILLKSHRQLTFQLNNNINDTPIEQKSQEAINKAIGYEQNSN